ncbi:Uncharacterized protein YjlB [Faunimonas pinastri]|uniref:Uncharacterized protein YjlB n=1 Tax=Faunimonas pinastri TaxID=1855383 RepID=A0A1H9FNW6_9HYPH|nr:cupin domain-containing protein [Faunimonas pinastri]SEQ39575.1 Uncharacterized protein YjlB [Faunimonas pinastri]
MAEADVEIFSLEPDGGIPNNSLPVLFYRDALKAGDCFAEGCQTLFQRNGWEGTWVNGVFAYWHFHTEGHEVLGVVSGKAKIGLGGDNRIEVDLKAGDVVVLPAGTGHKRLSASSDFSIVGAYPPGQNGRVIRPESSDIEKAAAAIKHLPLPATDPVLGGDGALVPAWRDKTG